MAKFFYTYVLRLSNGLLDVGATDDLKRRLHEHDTGHGGHSTAGKIPELIYYEACRSLREARAREHQLKTGYGGLVDPHDCQLVTTDADFARFPSLRWRNLLHSAEHARPPPR